MDRTQMISDYINSVYQSVEEEKAQPTAPVKGLAAKPVVSTKPDEDKSERRFTFRSPGSVIFDLMSDYFDDDEVAMDTMPVTLNNVAKQANLNNVGIVDIIRSNLDTSKGSATINIPKGRPKKPEVIIDEQKILDRFADRPSVDTTPPSTTDDGDEVTLGKVDEGLMSKPKTNRRIVDSAPFEFPDNIDFDFIKEREGLELSIGVPTEIKDGKKVVLDNSGPTIASGFDLGQRNINDLKGLPQPLIDKLKPYLGKTQEEALKYVNENKLTITKEEANTINEFAKEQEYKKLEKLWNASSKIGTWQTLSKEKATVVASVAFQYGNLPSKTPDFWRYVTNGQWDNALTELKNFGDKYPTRRKKEAAYLEKDKDL